MSPILLDTHVAVWAAEGSLSRRAREIIDNAAERGELMLSPISAWEIGTLAQKGRLPLAVTPAEFVRVLFGKQGVLIAALTPSIAVTATELPGNFHGDPADRILIATAAAYGAQLMTRDSAIQRFARQTKYVVTMKC